MSQVLVTESYLDDIADAIRDKTGSEDTYTPAQMAGGIEDIHTADEVVLVNKSISANGTYNPASDSADGYSGVSVDVPNTYAVSDNGKVVVNQALTDQTSKSINANGTHDTTANNSVVVDVPNSYAAADEGKVVSGGALVGQTSRNVTVNGTYDTTTNNEVVVNVSGGGGGTGGDPIPFIVTASSVYDSAYSAQNAFNDSGFWGSNGGTTEWLKLQFNDPVKITAIKFGNTFITGNLHWTSSRITFQASNDNTTWVDLYDATNLSDSPGNYYEYLLQNNNEYIYYRFLCYKGSYYAGIGKIKLSFENASLITKTITQNGTYNASDDSADGYNQVTVNVSGGSSLALIDYDFTKLSGTVRGVTYNSNGATFQNSSTSKEYIPIISAFPDITLYVDVRSMSFSNKYSHRRFIMGDYSNGFIYRTTGKWAFYSGSWEESDIIDDSYFSNSKVKVYIDSSNKWHIYKNNILVFEPTNALAISDLMIGSSEQYSIIGAVITGLRVYQGDYTET